MSELEKKAMALGEDEQQLETRLQSARYLLIDEYRPYFRKPTYDFAGKRLVGSEGYVLQWKLRRNPDAPENYENQQTSVGIVVLTKEKL